jgi:hypothetical protein
VLLRDLNRRDDDLAPMVETIVRVAPDFLLLTDFDYDYGHAALHELRAWTAEEGLDYPHLFSLQSNAGRPTGVDVDRDGRLGRGRDAQGWGRFSGQGGMAVLSRFPFGEATDLSQVLWKDMGGALIVTDDPAYEIQRLSSDGHWIVPVMLPDAEVSVMAFHATTPVFDGPDDRNGRRNHDEIAIWSQVLAGTYGPAPDRFVILGDANLDPSKGEGIRSAIHDLLARPDLSDPLQGVPTVDWSHLGLGQMRVSYALPSKTLQVQAAGTDTIRPETGHHGLVWVDVAVP